MTDDRDRLHEGLHGRTPASVLAWWAWLLDHAAEEGRGPAFAAIVAELVKRADELREVLAAVLLELPVAQTIAFLDACIAATLEQGPDAQAANRQALRSASELRRAAIDQARDLADTLERFAALCERSGLDAVPFRVLRMDNLLMLAGEKSPLFTQYPGQTLEALSQRYYHGKYWPSTAEALRALAESIALHETEFSDEDDELATSLSGPVGPAGLVRVIGRLMRGDPAPADYHPGAPIGWAPVKLTDAGLANLLSVLLRRPPDDLVDADLVKRARQRTE